MLSRLSRRASEGFSLLRGFQKRRDWTSEGWMARMMQRVKRRKNVRARNILLLGRGSVWGMAFLSSE